MVTWAPPTVHTFGTAAAPSAGAPTPAPAAQGAFSFGSTPAPAAPAPGGGLFGSANPTTAPAAGGGFAFGASPAKSPAPAGGLFGSSPAPAAGGLFGSTIPAPAPAGGGLFGAASPVPAGGAVAAPSPAGGLFGAPTPAPAFGGFGGGGASASPGVASAGPAQAAYAAHAHMSARQEASRLESAILGLHAAFSPTATSSDPLHSTSPGVPGYTHPSSLCRFQYIFYDPVTAEQRHAQMVHASTHPGAGAGARHAHSAVPRPAHVSAARWAEALARNPDPENYVPVCIVGAEALSARVSSQQDRARTLAKGVAQLRDTIESVLKQSVGKSEDALVHARRENEVLRKRLLGIMRKVEICRCMNLPLQGAERDIMERLTNLLRNVERLGQALGEVEERAGSHAHFLRSGGVGGVSEAGKTEMELSEEDKRVLYKVLDEQRAGLASLASIMKKDVRDAGIMTAELAKGVPAAGGIADGGARMGGGIGSRIASGTIGGTAGLHTPAMGGAFIGMGGAFPRLR